MNEKITGKKTIKYLILILLSLLTTISLAMVSHIGITGFDLVLPCVFALAMLVYNKAADLFFSFDAGKLQIIKKDLWASVIFGLIASLAAVVGSHIDMDIRVFTSLGLTDCVYEVFLFIFFVSIFRLLFFSSDGSKINKLTESVRVEDVSKKQLIKYVLIYTCILIVCWLPYYLTYFPGGIGNDDFECIEMCLGYIGWTNHNPVLYIATLNFFIKITAAFGGGLTAALGIMTTLQMVMFAVTIAFIITWMYVKGVCKSIRYISLGFYGLHPIMAMYSIYLTKDIIFACVVSFLIMFLMDFIPYVLKCNEKNEKVSGFYFAVLGILSLLAILTRNNGTFIIAGLAVVMLVVFKKYWKQILLTFAVVFVANAIYKGPVWNALGIEKQSFAESASIPLSQVAYTIYTDGEIQGENRAYLERLMPLEKVKEEFEPGFTDSYKFSESFDKQLLDDNPGEFMKVWFKLLPHNFGRYVEAYLMQTSGYWKYGVSNTVATAGVQPNDLGIEAVDVIQNISGISLTGILEALVLVARKLPVLCFLSQMGIQILAVLVIGYNYFRRGKGIYAVSLVPLVVLWISVMIATPAHCLFRYMFPFFMLWPVILFTRADR